MNYCQQMCFIYILYTSLTQKKRRIFYILNLISIVHVDLLVVTCWFKTAIHLEYYPQYVWHVVSKPVLDTLGANLLISY